MQVSAAGPSAISVLGNPFFLVSLQGSSVLHKEAILFFPCTVSTCFQVVVCRLLNAEVFSLSLLSHLYASDSLHLSFLLISIFSFSFPW